jgi:hypothetical protein
MIMIDENNSGMKTTEKRNIAKSGDVLNWGAFTPFQLQLELLVNSSQIASCYMPIRQPEQKLVKLFKTYPFEN